MKPSNFLETVSINQQTVALHDDDKSFNLCFEDQETVSYRINGREIEKKTILTDSVFGSRGLKLTSQSPINLDFCVLILPGLFFSSYPCRAKGALDLIIVPVENSYTIRDFFPLKMDF